MSNLDLLENAMALLGEGPSWDDKRNLLYWVDIVGCKVHIFDPKSGKSTVVQLDDYVSCIVPWNSNAMITQRHGFYSLELDTGAVSPIATLETDLNENRFNDGKCDPSGRFWAGTMNMDEKRATGSLYCLERNRSIRRALKGLTISNGLGWSPDSKEMFHIDTPTGKVISYEYDLQTGRLGTKRVAVDFTGQNGVPDGMAVDSDGMLWIAHWGGSAISRWDPGTGKMAELLNLPVSQVTSCCFGGERLDELYITSARSGLSEQQAALEPSAGGLFRVRVRVPGMPTNAYSG